LRMGLALWEEKNHLGNRLGRPDDRERLRNVARHRLEAYATLTPSRGSDGRAELPSGSIDTPESNDRGAAVQWDGPFPEAARYRDGEMEMV